MYYIWHANELGAGADGRKKGEPLSANFSPSLGLKGKGLMSVLKSFAKPDLKRIVNGGPLTIELHSSVFSNEDSIDKVAQMVKYYMDINGQQMQLNALNRDELLEAQKNPEEHKDMIVRVWGCSGYFCELDKEFQDHIIARTEFDT
jgi:formate C-acetyltransferase